MPSDFIDLRSDTVTAPTENMKKAIANAKLGDDVYGEDPTVNELQNLAAKKMGKEAALFMPSGTMSNLAAVLTHCQRGDEAILGNLSHMYLLEAGGMAALGGIHPYPIPNNPDGTLSLNQISEAIRTDNIHFPHSKLLILENTHNRCGGTIITGDYTKKAAKIAHDANMKLHLDGARIFNASIALNVDVKELVEPADTITFCLSKGLCAPAGALLCGSSEFINKALRIRKQLGGGMRQSGILAAAGIVALEEMVDRLHEDHNKIKKLSSEISNIPGLVIDNQPPATNMLFVSIPQDKPYDAEYIASSLLKHNIKIGTVSKNSFRLVTHYWIKDSDIEKTVQAFKKVLA